MWSWLPIRVATVTGLRADFEHNRGVANPSFVRMSASAADNLLESSAILCTFKNKIAAARGNWQSRPLVWNQGNVLSQLTLAAAILIDELLAIRT